MTRELKSIMALMGLIAMSLSWLIPNKAYPWLPAWNEGLAFAAILMLWVAAAARTWKYPSLHSGIAWPLIVFVVLAVSVAWIQYGTGLLVFSGDAFMVSLYLSIYLIAIHVGSFMARQEEKEEWMTALLFTLVMSAIASIGIALVQWTQTWSLAVFFMESDMGDRPGANLGQINNFSTLCFIALCASLCLYSRSRLNIYVMLLAGCFLAFGMAITQSRTGWLQMAFIFAVLIFQKNDKNRNVFLFVFAIFVTWYFVVPLMGSKAFITADQNFRDLPMHDVRITMWSALLEAVSMWPWFGYGWLQTGWAQQATAESVPILRTYMSYSHNFILDLIVWNGWPLAIIFAGLICLWFFRHLVYRGGSSEVFLYCLVAGVFIHGLLEYPLSYAYFLMPAGLVMGYLDGKRSIFKEYGSKLKLQVPWVMASAILYFAVCIDYVKSVSVDVAVRMQSAQIGRDIGLPDVRPEFLILSQLKAMYDVRVMHDYEYESDKNILLMARVARRYPYSPALYQYALARAMRGEYAAAEKQLRVLCGIYSEAHCNTIEKRWENMQKKYPESVGLVDFPSGLSKGFEEGFDEIKK
ncbi:MULTISPECIES: PglL family O-oligosaccharyltransferase [unclassified Simplicispira]|uniref:PglL family O-oligosaccharyltransferase n=1 Tax=unclassified Simplicispira TaxID=2630407 RepID=UPI000E2849B9|nr:MULTISPECIES: Wzy polymerase domain-containing protein [unclassified Simplicispira]